MLRAAVSEAVSFCQMMRCYCCSSEVSRVSDDLQGHDVEAVLLGQSELPHGSEGAGLGW